jgi:hypothetical protein
MNTANAASLQHTRRPKLHRYLLLLVTVGAWIPSHGSLAARKALEMPQTSAPYRVSLGWPRCSERLRAPTPLATAADVYIYGRPRRLCLLCRVVSCRAVLCCAAVCEH